MTGRLVDEYDLVILDLDGVVYLIDHPIPSAVSVINRLRTEGRALTYVTNNASRRSSEVADMLGGMGIAAAAHEVLTSAAAAAQVLAERFPAGSPVLTVGAAALREEVRAVGLRPVAGADEAPVAVVQGYGPQVGWAQFAEACVAVRAGALWVATNVDRTLPSPRGPLPGNGALVAALAAALDREPDLVVGKPEPGLFAAAARRAKAHRPLVVGDRLDTDIEGAARVGMDSLLVLTGVTRPRDLLCAPVGRQPTYVAADLNGLTQPAAAVRVAAGRSGWRVATDDGRLRLTGAGEVLDALRTLCHVAWTTRAIGEVRAGSVPAADALRELGLAPG
ncbi:MAG TPA: HAD-IIA family hydrolase [Micromonosporaceae bacterium]